LNDSRIHEVWQPRDDHQPGLLDAILGPRLSGVIEDVRLRGVSIFPRLAAFKTCFFLRKRALAGIIL
jgi:hypothetical protein